MEIKIFTFEKCQTPVLCQCCCSFLYFFLPPSFLSFFSHFSLLCKQDIKPLGEFNLLVTHVRKQEVSDSHSSYFLLPSLLFSLLPSLSCSLFHFTYLFYTFSCPSPYLFIPLPTYLFIPLSIYLFILPLPVPLPIYLFIPLPLLSPYSSPYLSIYPTFWMFFLLFARGSPSSSLPPPNNLLPFSAPSLYPPSSSL